MEADALSRRLANLPDAARREVEALIAEWERKQRAHAEEHTPLRAEPFVGLWEERDDMGDSTNWVRTLRQSEWHRG